MSKHTDYELEDEEMPYRKLKVKRVQSSQQKPVKKESYESNVDVQRWLQSQSLKEDEA